jgi:hypothetical protein
MVTNRFIPLKTTSTDPQPRQTSSASLALPPKSETLGSWVADMAWALRVAGRCSHKDS